MKNLDKSKMLKQYIMANVAPVLIEGLNINSFKDAVILSSKCDNSLLNGHYEGTEFVAPDWYNQLINKTGEIKILIISEIDDISVDEQVKFLEILKYRKISTFELPENCTIVITASRVNSTLINKEVYSLVAHI